MDEAAQLRKFRVPKELPINISKWRRVVNARWMDENTLEETAAIFKLVDDEGFTTPITYQVDKRDPPVFKSGFGILNTEHVFENWQDLRLFWPEYINILREEGCEGFAEEAT